MTRRFCVLCGKATDELIENICVECFKRETTILSLPALSHGEVCGYCGARRSHGAWIEPGAEQDEAVLKAALESLDEAMTVGIEDAEVSVELRGVKKSSDKVFLVSHEVTVKGVVEGVALESKGTSTADVRLGMCDDCTRMKSGYFEAVLQIRGEDGLDKNQRKIVGGIVEDFFRVDRGKRAFVAKVEELREGVDYYVGSVKAARKLARVIQQKFGGSVSESPKLVGKKDGKDLLRVSIAVRLPLGKH